MDPVAAPAEAANRRRVLVFAYACEPGRGSEPGAGWGLVRTLATFADCTVLVGPEHTPGIRKWEARHGHAHLRFIEVPERWITPPSRRHRLTRFVLYLLWLPRAFAIGRSLHRRAPFAAVWHATYSTYWLPSPAVRFGIPCVWGPVGGGVVTPRSLRPLLGWRGLTGELFDLVAVRAFSLWPATRRTWRRARIRVVQNAETLARLPHALQPGTIVLNHALFTEASRVPPGIAGRQCLFVGSLESRKGASLAVRALACAAEDVTLLVVGDGPERLRLEQLAQGLECRAGSDSAAWRRARR